MIIANSLHIFILFDVNVYQWFVLSLKAVMLPATSLRLSLCGQTKCCIWYNLQCTFSWLYMWLATNSVHSKPHTVYLYVLTSVVLLQPVSILLSIAALINFPCCYSRSVKKKTVNPASPNKVCLKAETTARASRAASKWAVACLISC